MHTEEYSTEIQRKNDKLILTLKDFSGELDIEDALQVDYNNIIGDIITFPVLFNRISVIKADIETLEAEVKLELSIIEADKFAHYQEHLVYTEDDSKGNPKKVRPTEARVKAAVMLDKKVKAKKRELIEVQRQSKVVDGLYWAMKSKDKKLDAISAKLTPEEFEIDILEGSINSVMIRSKSHLIQSKR